MDIQPGMEVRLRGGAFADRVAVVLSIQGDKAEVELEIFGSIMPYEVPLDQLESFSPTARNRVRQDLVRDISNLLPQFDKRWWCEHCERHPEPLDPLVEWQTWRTDRKPKEQLRDSLLEQFDDAFPESMSDEEFSVQWTERQTHWLQHLTEKFSPSTDRLGMASQRLDAARDAYHRDEQRKQYEQFQEEFLAFRREQLPDARALQALREAGRQRAHSCEPVVRERILRTHGLILPDSFFTFFAWLSGLSDPERNALGQHVGLGWSGIVQLCWEYERIDTLKPGIDDRLIYRYYRDPPEFLTVMNGDTDGLHFGLWFDDPSRPADRVYSYYNNDSLEISLCGRTMLEAVRDEIETHQSWFDSMSEKEQQTYDPEMPYWLALLRLSILEYETSEFPERGDDYKGFSFSEPRIATVDRAGVLVPESYRQRDTKEVYEVLRADPSTLTDRVQQALRECEAGDPSEALALGRDFHCMSFGEAEREQTALRLLDAGYRALGRDALTDIAHVHHQHRGIQTVDSYHKP